MHRYKQAPMQGTHPRTPRLHNVGTAWRPGALILAECQLLSWQLGRGWAAFIRSLRQVLLGGLSEPVERESLLPRKRTCSTTQADPGPPAQMAGRSQTVSCSRTASCPWVISCSLSCQMRVSSLPPDLSHWASCDRHCDTEGRGGNSEMGPQKM